MLRDDSIWTWHRLLVGSEGTLALVTTEATLSHRAACRRHRGVALLLFDGLEKAARSRVGHPALWPPRRAT